MQLAVLAKLLATTDSRIECEQPVRAYRGYPDRICLVFCKPIFIIRPSIWAARALTRGRRPRCARIAIGKVAHAHNDSSTCLDLLCAVLRGYGDRLEGFY